MFKQKVISESDLAKLQKIGQTIKNKREDMSYSLSQLSEITRISVSDINAIEQALYKEYPDMVFLKGFIRAFCIQLNLDSQWMIDDLNSIFENDKDQNKIDEQFYKNTQQKSDFKNINPKPLLKAAVSSFLFVLIVIAGYFFYKTYKNQNQTDSAIPVFDATASTNQNAASQTQLSGLNLVLTAQKSGWVAIQLDEENTKYFKINVDETKQWTATDFIKITLSRGDLARILVNGLEDPVDEVYYDKLYEKTFRK